MIMKGSKQEGLCRGEEDHFLTSDESNSHLNRFSQSLSTTLEIFIGNGTVNINPKEL